MAYETFALSPESLTKILQLVSNQVETLTYLQSALAEKIKKSGTKAEYSDLMNEVTKLVDSAVYQENRLSQLDLWSGKTGLVDQLHAIFNANEFSAFQEFIVAKVAVNIPVEPLTLDCIISDEAEFRRAYSVNGKPLEGEALETMDTLFNAWLAQPENKMVMQDGVIYAGTDNGTVVKDMTSNAVKIRADKVRDLLVDPVRGFARYAQQLKSGTQLTVIKHETEREEAAPSQ